MAAATQNYAATVQAKWLLGWKKVWFATKWLVKYKNPVAATSFQHLARDWLFSCPGNIQLNFEM